MAADDPRQRTDETRALRRVAREEALDVLRLHGPDVASHNAVLCRAVAAACYVAAVVTMALPWLSYQDDDGGTGPGSYGEFTAWTLNDFKFHEAPSVVLIGAVVLLLPALAAAVFSFQTSASVTAAILAVLAGVAAVWNRLVEVPDGYLGHEGLEAHAALPTFVALMALTALLLAVAGKLAHDRARDAQA
ncbi:MAG: hypothetical protein GEV10_03390 [Streptosporangiales bacterium]|nr:hypothetical protein [Streptosporangiales bacterium]